MNGTKSFGKRQPADGGWADVIFLTRMTRDDERKWQSARSWLGGLPAIAAERWPRSRQTGLPLHHLAQVNLAELPRGPRTPQLPPMGQLNFFADTSLDSGKVEVGVVLSEERPEMKLPSPPADCPPVHGDHWFYHCKGTATEAEAPRVFRQWPIAFMLLPSAGRSYPDAEEMMARLGPQPESIHIFAPGALAHVQSGVFPWEAVRRVVEDFKNTVNEHARLHGYQSWMRFDPEAPVIRGQPRVPDTPEKYEARWQRADRKLDAVRSFVDDWSKRLQGRDPFGPIGTTIADAIDHDTQALLRQGFRCRYAGGSTALAAAASDVYRDMMVSPVELFARIPKEIRDHLVNERRLSGWRASLHQMFGVVPTIQQSIEDFEDEVLLFSAGSDDMLSWLWGDVGVIHFLISPEDLAAQRWNKVRGLFEGH